MLHPVGYIIISIIIYMYSTWPCDYRHADSKMIYTQFSVQYHPYLIMWKYLLKDTIISVLYRKLILCFSGENAMYESLKIVLCCACIWLYPCRGNLRIFVTRNLIHQLGKGLVSYKFTTRNFIKRLQVCICINYSSMVPISVSFAWFAMATGCLRSTIAVTV